MPFVQNGDAKIYYEVSGEGFPILMLAAGFMQSRIDSWPRLERTFPTYRFDPLVHFASEFTMVAMDQRNARGQSVAPVTPSDGWHNFASDQIAVLDAAGVEKCHVWGGCIGAPFALELCRLIPDRIVSVVMQDPIGVDPRDPLASVELFKNYAKDILAERPDLTMENLMALAHNLYAKDFDKEFAFTVTREFLRECPIPMLVMPGFDDQYHPLVTAEEIYANTPNCEIDREWMSVDSPKKTENRIRSFLNKHTPKDFVR